MPMVQLSNRVQFSVGGEEAAPFLQSLVTTDIDVLAIGEWRPAALLTAQGKVQFVFLIARNGADLLIDADERDAAALAKRLGFYKLRAKVVIGPVDRVSTSVCWDEPPPLGFLRDVRFGNTQVWRGTSAGDLGAVSGWNALRIRHGVAEPHTDFAYGEVFAHDINLDQTGGLSFSKGCFVGQEVVSRMHHRSTARWRTMVATGAGELVSGAPVLAGHKPAGTIGTVVDNTGIALVRLDRVRDAMNNGLAVTADSVVLEISFPEGVDFGWPQAASVSS